MSNKIHIYTRHAHRAMVVFMAYSWNSGIRTLARITSLRFVFFFRFLLWEVQIFCLESGRQRWERERARRGRVCEHTHTLNFLWCQCWCLCDTSKAYIGTMTMPMIYSHATCDFLIKNFVVFFSLPIFEMHSKPVKWRQHTLHVK